MYKKLTIILGVMLIVICVFVSNRPATPVALGSVQDGQAYNSTTTSSVVGTTWTGARTLTPTSATRAGILGSVIITKATTATINIYDATTTNVNLRTGQKATSSILMASFPASTAVGTYVFDTEYDTGLVVDPEAGGLIASSTITYK